MRPNQLLCHFLSLRFLFLLILIRCYFPPIPAVATGVVPVVDFAVAAAGCLVVGQAGTGSAPFGKTASAARIPVRSAVPFRRCFPVRFAVCSDGA